MTIETRLLKLLSENGFQISLEDLDYPLDFDSLRYMELLILIEEEFEFDLAESDFVELNSFKDLFELVTKKYEEVTK